MGSLPVIFIVKWSQLAFVGPATTRNLSAFHLEKARELRILFPTPSRSPSFTKQSCPAPVFFGLLENNLTCPENSLFTVKNLLLRLSVLAVHASQCPHAYYPSFRFIFNSFVDPAF